MISSLESPEYIDPTVDAAQERPRTESEIALRLMAEMATEVNETLGEKIVGPDGRLKMFMYSDVLGKERVQNDNSFVRMQKAKWAGLNDPTVLEQEIVRLGLQDRVAKSTPEQRLDRILQAHDVEQAGRSGALAEAAATTLLHRGLRGEFVVVRSAAFDDYRYGLDTIMVNPSTGEVVCAFDEVVGSEHDERVEEKRRRQAEAVARGGVNLDYGFTFENGQVVKKSFKHVPVFRLRLGRVEVNAVLTECETQTDLGLHSQQVLARLIESLEQQTDEYLADPKVNATMREKLERYKSGSLSTMRAVAEQSLETENKKTAV